MSDAFALLGEPRRPWIDPDSLKQRFLSLSNPLHPDRHHGASESERSAASQQYAELNAAYQTLREHRDRLLLLLELELGSRPRDIQRIPPGTMDLFVEVGQTCRDCDEFLKKKSAALSPILRLQILQAGLEWIDRLNALQGRIRTMEAALDQELRSLNGVWDSAPPAGTQERTARLPLERLEQIYRSLSYVSRWTAQIQERVVAVSV